MKKDSFVRGTIIGAAIGTVAGILLAPKSGRETRQDLKRKAKYLRQDATKRVEQMRRDLGGRIDELKTVAKDLRGEAREESQALIERAEHLKEDLRTSASRIGRNGSKLKDDALVDVKRLMDQGAGVMTELEQLTRKVVSSAKDKLKSDRSDRPSGPTYPDEA